MGSIKNSLHQPPGNVLIDAHRKPVCLYTQTSCYVLVFSRDGFDDVTVCANKCQ